MKLGNSGISSPDFNTHKRLILLSDSLSHLNSPLEQKAWFIPTKLLQPPADSKCPINATSLEKYNVNKWKKGYRCLISKGTVFVSDNIHSDNCYFLETHS